MWYKLDKDKISEYVPVIILCAFTIAVSMLPLAKIPYLWFDESFTINLIRKPWREMFRLAAFDVHPPLYYICMKLFISLFGESTLSYHAVSLLCYCVMIAASALFFLKYFNKKTAATVVLALCALPGMQYYALEIRMYSMSAMWILLGFYMSHILCLRFDENRFNKEWILLAFLHVAAAYTHYFAGVAAVGTSFFLLIRLLYEKKKYSTVIRQWLLYCFLMFVLYLPWFRVMMRQMRSISGNYWIPPIGLSDLAAYQDILFQTQSELLTGCLTAFFFIGTFLMVWKTVRSRDKWLIGGFFTAAFWLSFGYVYSVLDTPILMNRYMAMLIPILWIPVIVSIIKFSDKIVTAGLIFVLLLTFIQTNREISALRTEANDNEMIAYLAQQMKEDDVFFHIRAQELSVCKAYFPAKAHYIRTGSYDHEAFQRWGELTDCIEIEALENLQDINGDIWCISGDFIPAFEELGYECTEEETGNKTVYHILKP